MFCVICYKIQQNVNSAQMLPLLYKPFWYTRHTAAYIRRRWLISEFGAVYKYSDSTQPGIATPTHGTLQNKKSQNCCAVSKDVHLVCFW